MKLLVMTMLLASSAKAATLHWDKNFNISKLITELVAVNFYPSYDGTNPPKGYLVYKSSDTVNPTGSLDLTTYDALPPSNRPMTINDISTTTLKTVGDSHTP